MIRLTLKGLQANKVRFALTTFGVILAVSFVVSALVLGDGLRRSFTDVSQDIVGGVDLQVRPTSEFGEPEPLPTELVDIVAGIDGVAAANGSIEAAESSVRPIPASGEPISLYGPPQLAYGWVEDTQISSLQLVTGHAPELGQFVIDLDSAAEHGFVVGQTYDVLTPNGRHPLTVSGTVTFGPDNATLGSVIMAMNSTEAATLFAVDGINSVDVRLASNVDSVAVQQAVQAAVADAVPNAEVVDIATVLEETKADFTEAVNIVSNILLGFGGVALFVSIFIIYNTFAIVLGQRTRELALLRTIGASPVQIRRSVIGEALIVGVLASVGGIGGGIVVAKGIDALVGATGVELPDYPFVLSSRTIIAAVVIGMGVTLLACLGPARKASTVPAIAALNAVTESSEVDGSMRKLSGVALVGVGVIAGLVGLGGAGSTTVTITMMALGAIGVFLGVTLLSPLMVGAVTQIVGWPMRTFAGVAGAMAQRNAARNPRRTATTAAALMIGLALVSTALVVGESIKQHIGGTLDDVATADYFVTDELDEVDYPAAIVAQISASPGVAEVAGFAYIEAQVDSEVLDITATDLAALESVLDLGLQDPIATTEANPLLNPVLVQSDEADRQGLVVGDAVTTTFSNGNSMESTVTGLFATTGGITTDYLYDVSSLDQVEVVPTYEWLAITLFDNTEPAAIDELKAAIASEFPDAYVDTTDEYTKRVEGSIDNLLAIINVMVALAVVIALIGIANTLALSVFERTRELGLVRAVGMTRRQLRRMIRFEAALVSTFGAVLGVGVGLLFGWGVVSALPDTITGTIAVPVPSVLILMAVAAAAGVIAAWLPARRAGRLYVLDAIGH